MLNCARSNQRFSVWNSLPWVYWLVSINSKTRSQKFDSLFFQHFYVMTFSPPEYRSFSSFITCFSVKKPHLKQIRQLHAEQRPVRRTFSTRAIEIFLHPLWSHIYLSNMRFRNQIFKKTKTRLTFNDKPEIERPYRLIKCRLNFRNREERFKRKINTLKGKKTKKNR